MRTSISLISIITVVFILQSFVVEQDKNLTKKILEDKTPKINSEFLSLVNNFKLL